MELSKCIAANQVTIFHLLSANRKLQRYELGGKKSQKMIYTELSVLVAMN